MDDAGLHPGPGKDGRDRVGQAERPSTQAIKTSRTPRWCRSIQNGQPELRLNVLPPDAERFAVAVDGDPDGQLAGAGADGAVFGHRDHQRVEVDERIDRLQKAGAPVGEVFEHRVGDPRARVAADLHPEEALQMRGNVADRPAAGVEVQDPVIQAGQPGLAPAHQPRIERPRAIARSADRDLADSVLTVLAVCPLR